jgi:hypothetical protein
MRSFEEKAHIITFIFIYVSVRPCVQISICAERDYIISVRWDSSVGKAMGLGWEAGV